MIIIIIVIIIKSVKTSIAPASGQDERCAPRGTTGVLVTCSLDVQRGDELRGQERACEETTAGNIYLTSENFVNRNVGGYCVMSMDHGCYNDSAKL